MTSINLMRTICIAAILSVANLGSAVSAVAKNTTEGPALPPVCGAIQVPQGQQLAFHTYAVGVQVYRWNGAGWDFVGPVARLSADPYYQRLIGSHFGGPTWVSNNGSSVVAARVDGCTPDASAIPWLLLKATSTEGNGLFGRTTFIHRVNTSGGLAPGNPGPAIGFEVRVPYTAEYYFYRAEN